MSVTINQEENIDVQIGFFLDGVPDYRNLTTTLPEYSSLSVYANPIIDGFGPPAFTQTFTSTWPLSERYLNIKVVLCVYKGSLYVSKVVLGGNR